VEEEKVTQCSICEKKSEPCISFFAHENSMMHKDVDNERAHRTTLFVCITFIIITIIFVFAYLHEKHIGTATQIRVKQGMYKA